MPNYQNAMIYKLWSPEGDDIYIGSTSQTLAQRKAKHKSEYQTGKNLTSSKILFEKYTDVRIELIEECPCDKKSKLIAREGHYIRTLDCVNKRIPDRTKQEYLKEYYENNSEHIKEYYKEWCENNREHIKEVKKEHRENNKEHIKEVKKEYYENNKEHYKEKHKEYRENNKQKIKQHASEKITCECGCEIRRGHLSHHKRTQKHIKLMENM